MLEENMEGGRITIMILEKSDIEYFMGRIDGLRTIVEHTQQKMLRDPDYDSHPDVSRIEPRLDELKRHLECEKRRAGVKGLLSSERPRIQHLQNEVADLLKLVEHTQQKMLRDPDYRNSKDLTRIMIRLDALYANLKEELRLTELEEK